MKTKKIYIFDEHISSQKNGIGTYLRELLFCLNPTEYNICLVIFNADTEEFNIIEEAHYKKMLFPTMNAHFLSHVQVVDKFLRLYIQDDSDNIFFLNHSPCLDLIKSLKELFPLSKIAFTIHDFGWTAPLMGNLKEFKHLVKNKSYDMDDMEKTKKDFVINYFEEETEMYRLADRIICLSQDSYDILRTVYKLDNEKIALITNGLILL